MKSPRCVRKRNGFRKLNRTLTATVIELGRELIDVKARLPHGQFGPWVEAECGFTIRTAENYIKAAKFVVGKNETAVSHLAPAVVYQLAAKSAPAALVDRVAKGEVVTDGEVKAELAKAKREKQDHPPEIKKSEPKIELSKPATVTTLAEMGKQVRAMSAPTKPDTVAVTDPLVIDREDEIEATPGSRQRSNLFSMARSKTTKRNRRWRSRSSRPPAGCSCHN